MMTFSPCDCWMIELRRREHVATAERHAALTVDAATFARRTPLVVRLTVACSRVVASLVRRRSPRPSLQVAPRS